MGKSSFEQNISQKLCQNKAMDLKWKICSGNNSY